MTHALHGFEDANMDSALTCQSDKQFFSIIALIRMISFLKSLFTKVQTDEDITFVMVTLGRNDLFVFIFFSRRRMLTMLKCVKPNSGATIFGEVK